MTTNSLTPGSAHAGSNVTSGAISNAGNRPVWPSRRSTPLLRELDREWQRLRHRPHTLRGARAWHRDPVLSPHVIDLRDLDDLVTATQPDLAGEAASNAVLAHLTQMAGDDDLAGRVVLQRLLPGIISRASRWRAETPTVNSCDIAVGSAWVAIRNFDVSARSENIAPALIADALWIGFRRSSRRKDREEIPTRDDLLGINAAPAVEAEPAAALAGMLRAAQRAGVPAADLDIVRQLATAGSPSQAARDCAVTVRTIRNRRDAAALKIREALGPEWAEWRDPLCAA